MTGGAAVAPGVRLCRRRVGVDRGRRTPPLSSPGINGSAHTSYTLIGSHHRLCLFANHEKECETKSWVTVLVPVLVCRHAQPLRGICLHGFDKKKGERNEETDKMTIPQGIPEWSNKRGWYLRVLDVGGPFFFCARVPAYNQNTREITRHRSNILRPDVKLKSTHFTPVSRPTPTPP